MKILIKNGRVIDPANNINEIMDLLLENELIAKVGKNLEGPVDMTIDAADKIVMPGIVDIHVHLREPGREDKETIASGTKAALKGGVTSVLAMPNTTPAIDSLDQVKKLKNIIHKSAHANVLIAATITQGRLGSEVVDVSTLKKEGIIAITDDGSSVDSDEIMLKALEKAKEEGVLVICHCEDKALSNQGVMSLGFISTQLGLRGIPKEAEYKRVQRDIQLASRVGATIHIAHISTKESLDLIAEAKRRGTPVSAETAPHYFSLSEEAVLGYDTNKKINPPLRTEEDVKAIRQGLKDGTIDVIASDHAPHTENEKEIEFDRAEFGVIGLETELAVSITELLNTGSSFGKDAILDWPGLVKKLSLNPAKILGVNKGTLGVGCDADIIVVDPNKEWKVAKDSFVSKSKNSAFIDRALKGVVEYTICAGKVAYKLTQ